ncbi:DNA protecting protein DprA [Snodgrassella communis]|jgi:DNA processing protein|uniref:DNA protecting protein DprA n=2 Tax=Snodgrassella TaxID=1193515 RepID=A0A2N9XC38_9NEIS|nr:MULTISPECIES: DNA-processing protein DprA [Snodgrassella]KDN14986.1 Rossmann fold nucleotide-binding protein Smf possibly involved in DNA uptake [Snodgrassella communis]PIT08601.1 DNA protecting protein DprA [Snodgrassella communis]PIT08921.1 DNA protecting protein DprA [Snodgrassella communis]PIT21247.1 DNA protecting protein DprA [Snodgrassella communis]PIT25370.1 DNA protecting protein DprA [Snodgrassella communis]
MNEQERYAWIELALTPYIGSKTFLRLLNHFGSAQAILSASIAEIKPFLHRAQASRYWRSDEARQAAEAALKWEQSHADARLLLLTDNDYPVLLTEGLTPPPLLFIRGNSSCLHQPSLAIVGSRHATPQAMRIARDFAKALAQKGIAVISGMAAGIDTAAHQGALLGTGNTIAVWGTGIDRVYPACNKALAAQIAAHGCIISEFPLGTRSLAENFPRRNRLIAALSQGTLVVEAATESGSLITARLAGEMGREVMAIPGSIDNPLSKGCHALIKQGARLVENLADILQECPLLLQKTHLQSYSSQSVQPESQISMPSSSIGNPEDLSLASAPVSALSPIEQQILAGLGYSVVHPDTLITTLGMTATDVYAHLMALELGGWITALPGGCYQRIKS